MNTVANPQNPTDEYLLLIRGTHWNHGMSPAELQRVMTDFYSWVDSLVQRGVHRGAQPLVEEGKLVTGARGASVTDGVFAESKEAIAGYFLLAVSGMEAAVQLAQACPILAYGAQIEVRPVANMCRPMAQVKAASADWSDEAKTRPSLTHYKISPLPLMIETPQVIQTPEKHTAFIHLTVPRDKMGEVFGPAIGELLGAMSAQGVSPAGPCFAHHRKMEDGIFDFEVSFPVNTPVTAAGRMEPGKWPSQKAARTVMHGSYENLPDAWGEFMDWIAAAGHQSAPDIYECYVTGPESSPDPALWRTELIRPLL